MSTALTSQKAIKTFDDWIDLFHDWQKKIDLEVPGINEFQFEAKYGDLRSNEVEFGDFAGRPKWERVSQIPHAPVKDALLNLIVYQGDTEFASVEQQRNLFKTAPSQYDLEAATRIMAEEMRHGWQMCHVLMTHFGDAGRLEARKLLERRSWQHNRLLGSFNEDVAHWVDFYVYTDFVDRDGKYQLNMLSTCAFAPLARSMGPMLREESYHIGTGQTGLGRILRGGKVGTPLLQKYFNKWIPTAYDLFGVDGSSSAHWFYVWGLKGRFDEHKWEEPADRQALNEHSRGLYQNEVRTLIEQLNRLVPEDQPKLFAPDPKFNRSIGGYKGETWSLTGEKLTADEHEKHRAEVLPSAADEAKLVEIFKDASWIAPKS
ncbi:MAG TPA: Phenylacetic acid catabolic protein [Thermoanaerobaculia bacterium]|nr:Phenylacetic acid catabolic protein [Thermoanaerobaculia bacterium]